MMRRTLVAGMLFAISFFASGCCTDCQHNRQGLFRTLPNRQAASCGQCGGGGCGSCTAATPFAHLRQMLAGGAGCGEIYVDEWISDPPACKDPCDDCGNWIGPQAGQPRFAGWRNLWGYRNQQCSTCGHGHHSHHGHHGEHVIHEGDVAYEGKVIYEGSVVEETPTPTRKTASPQPSVLRRSAAAQRPYYVPRTASRPGNYPTR